jgi:hemerythrin-like domain-containing protein
MKAAVRMLREEHEVILGMLTTLEAIAQRVETEEAVPLSVLTDLQDFFMLYADRSHHGKEEDLLFPLLERKGVPRVGGPVGCMLVEHDQGRGFVGAMVRNAAACAKGEAAARNAWAGAAREYANLLRNHIWKENEVLFLMADRLLSSDEQDALANEFERVEAEKLGAETRAKLNLQIEKLARVTDAARG